MTPLFYRALIIACIAASLAAVPALAEGPDQAPTDVAASWPGDFTYGEDPANAVTFSHEKHVSDYGQTCDACHAEIFELKYGAALAKGDFRMQPMYEGKYCGACHNGETAFQADDFSRCNSCHTGAVQKPTAGVFAKLAGPKGPIELGSDETVAVFSHEAHDSFACRDCHTKLFPIKKTGTVTTMDEINGGKACGSCHNGEKASDASDCHKYHPKMAAAPAA